VVAADRAYYESVRAVSDQDAGSISLPDHVPERRFRLSGTEVRIGRRSKSRHIEPEIDLTGPPIDPGVSRLHAVLVAGPDQNWSVIDPGSPNGIMVNGKDVPPGEAVPLRDGDRIHLGAWTVITITRGEGLQSPPDVSLAPPAAPHVVKTSPDNLKSSPGFAVPGDGAT
jgi:pSer/pThr/pTyr-binding forkhead associated (FHA) protein